MAFVLKLLPVIVLIVAINGSTIPSVATKEDKIVSKSTTLSNTTPSVSSTTTQSSTTLTPETSVRPLQKTTIPDRTTRSVETQETIITVTDTPITLGITKFVATRQTSKGSEVVTAAATTSTSTTSEPATTTTVEATTAEEQKKVAVVQLERSYASHNPNRLDERLQALDCDIPLLPAESRLWRGNETHELNLPITVSVSIIYYK